MASLNEKIILVIDDADEVRILAKKILQGDGAQVICAASVDQGLEEAKTQVPHLIITDLSMPEKTGFHLLDFRRNDPLLKNIPTLVLSGMKDQQSVVTAISLGATDYILKPFRASLVLQKVRKALNLTSFYTKPLPQNGALDASCTVQADIIRLSEVGCEIESSVKFAAEAEVQLKSEVLNTLGIENVMMRTINEPSRYAEDGRYLSEVNFVGIDPELARKIRNRLGSLP